MLGEGLVSEADLVPAVPAAQTKWTCPVEVSGSPWNDTQAVVYIQTAVKSHKAGAQKC